MNSSTPDWEANSPQLSANLIELLHELRRSAHSRELPLVVIARNWHRRMMAGLEAPNPRLIGAFRGEPGLENLGIKVAGFLATPSSHVNEELIRFETKLQHLVRELDLRLPASHQPDADQLAAILDLCAWTHAEWVRIHPFANGAGRTARLWANSLALRYGLPPFIGLRPRPGCGYNEAGLAAMRGDWKPTAVVFVTLLDQLLTQLTGPHTGGNIPPP